MSNEIINKYYYIYNIDKQVNIDVFIYIQNNYINLYY